MSDPSRCPAHECFVLELDGSRHCNFDDCDWALPPGWLAAYDNAVAVGWSGYAAVNFADRNCQTFALLVSRSNPPAPPATPPAP